VIDDAERDSLSMSGTARRQKHFTKISAQPFGMAAESVPAEAGWQRQFG